MVVVLHYVVGSEMMGWKDLGQTRRKTAVCLIMPETKLSTRSFHNGFGQRRHKELSFDKFGHPSYG